MLALKTFRDKAAGLADLLNWSHLVDSGIVLCKTRVGGRRANVTRLTGAEVERD